MVLRVVVCGAAGGIGQPLSLLLKQALPAGSELVLYDVVPLIKGVAVDLSHVSTHVKLEYYLGDMKNADNAEVDKALKGATLVVIPAGVPRKPGMTRDDLFKINAGIVKGLIQSIAKNAPNALIAVITNPVNSIVPVALETLKKAGCYDRNRLFGVSSLDIVRAQTFIGELKGLDPTKVHVDVVGGHSPETMLPVLSQVTGVTFTPEEAEKLTVRIQEAGTEVVNAKDGAGSATLSMAYAAARFTLSLVRAIQGEKGIIEDAYVEVDGMEVSHFGVPVELSANGIARILPLPKMNAKETELLQKAMPIVKANIETGVKFATT
jgi:NAD-dependent malate dehydrogenase